MGLKQMHEKERTRWQRFCRWLAVKIWYENSCLGVDPYDVYDQDEKEKFYMDLALKNSKQSSK